MSNGRVGLQRNLHMIHECATYDGTQHRAHTERHPEDSCVHRSLTQRHKSDNDHHAALEDPRRSDARDCSANDKCHRRRSSAAHNTTDLEDQNSSKKDPFRGVELVDAAEDGVATCAGQQVGGSVPANVADGVEGVGECRDGDGDNCAVLSMLVASDSRGAGCSLWSYQGDEEDGHVHADHDCEEPE